MLLLEDRSYVTPTGSLTESALRSRVSHDPSLRVWRVTAQTNVAITTTAMNAGYASASKAEEPMADSLAPKPYEESRFPKLFGRISSLSKLKDDWNSYGSAAPNTTALFWARRVLDELLDANLAPATINASSDEGVALFFRLNNRRASIECLNSGEILAVFSEGDSVPKVWLIPQSVIKREIDTIHQLLTK